LGGLVLEPCCSPNRGVATAPVPPGAGPGRRTHRCSVTAMPSFPEWGDRCVQSPAIAAR